MLSKKLAVFLLAVGLGCSLLSVVPSAMASPPVLVEDGRAIGQIRVPSQPTPTEEFAAEELQIHLRQMTGAEVPIVAGDELPDRILVIVCARQRTTSVAPTHAANPPGTKVRVADLPARGFRLRNVR